MGTQGVPLKPIPHNEIKSAIKNNKGRLTYAAKALGICYDSIRKLIDPHPELVEFVAKCRNEFDHSLLDQAESVLVHAMNQHEKDLTNALKSTFFVLNNKGKERGYHPPSNASGEPVNVKDLEKLNTFFNSLSDAQKKQILENKESSEDHSC